MLGRMLPWRGIAAYPPHPPFNPLLFDGIAQFYPWRLFAARTWATGFVPLWNPYQFCGTPFLANDQSATLYPLNLVFLLLPVARAFGVSAVLHLFLTGAFLYWFLRRRVGMLPALLGAAAWQLSDWQISWLALPTFLCTSAWIPLSLLLVERCAEKPHAARALALGCCLGVMLLAGHLQIALYGLIFCAAYGITLLVRDWTTLQRTRTIISFALAAVIMLLLAAPQLLPTVELARVSHRAGAHASMSGYTGYIALAMPWYRLATLFSPSFFGRAYDYWDRGDIPYPETACFVGVAALLLACFGAYAYWAKQTGNSDTFHTRFFIISAIVAMLFALGTPLNLFTYFGIPGFSQSGSPARDLVLWTLCLAILAAYGLEALLQGRTLGRATVYTWAALLGVPLIATVLFIERQGQQFLRQIDRSDLLISLITAACALPLALRLSRSTQARERSILAATFTLLVVIDLFRAGYGFNTAAPLTQVYPETQSIAFIQRQSSGTAGAGPRVAVLNAAEGVYEQPGVLPPNAATVYELRDLQGYDSLQTGQYKAYLNQLNGNQESSPQENGNMDLSHYEAVVSKKAAAETDAEWILSPVPLGTEIPSLTDNGMYVYRQLASTYSRAYTQATQPIPAKVLQDNATRLNIQPQATGDLIVADQYYPGWKARVPGGTALPVVEGPDVFRTIPDAPSNKLITMAYEPTSFLLGLYFACVVLAATGVVLGQKIAGSVQRHRQ